MPTTTDDLVERFRTAVEPHRSTVGLRASGSQAAKQLRDYHAIGRVVRRLVGDDERMDYGKRIFDELAGVLGRKGPWLYAVRNFALRYDDAQLQALCGHGGKVAWGHVEVLLSLPAGERNRRQREIVANGWSPTAFRRQMQLRPKKANRPGRPLAGRESPEACLDRLAEFSRQWRNFYQKVVASRRSPLGGEINGRDLRKKAAQVIKAIEQLNEDCATLRRKLRKFAGSAK